MNKEAAGDDLGLTLQTAYVTKALVGLCGSDRFRLAVSADGCSFEPGLFSSQRGIGAGAVMSAGVTLPVIGARRRFVQLSTAATAGCR